MHNASFLARDSETGKICGVRLNAVGPSSGVELENDFGYNLNLIPKVTFLHTSYLRYLNVTQVNILSYVVSFIRI